jgi:hypothetical protein
MNPFAFSRTHSPQAKSLLNLNRAQIDCSMPGEFNLKTGVLLDALIASPNGLTKQEILEKIFPEYPAVSFHQQSCLEARIEKIIQRARKRYTQFGILIHWTRNVGRFTAIPTTPGNFCLQA